MNASTSRELCAELRDAVQVWVLLPVALAGLALALADERRSVPPSRAALGLLLLLLVGTTLLLRRMGHKRAVGAAHVGLLGMLLVAKLWFPATDTFPAALYLVVASGLALGPIPCAAIAGLATGMSLLGFVWASLPIPGIGRAAWEIGVIWGIAFLMCMFDRVLKGYLSWSWESVANAREELEELRRRQAELKHALSDLDLANREVIRLNDLLVAAREAIDEARRAKEEFVAAVSHELRTPLNMVIGFSDEILERPELYSAHLPEDLLTDIAAIKRNAEHLARLVDDVLDLSEADAGLTRLTKEPTSIRDVIADVRSTMAPFFERKGLRLTTRLAPNLPLIVCDAVRIRQVILNLVSNAARFTESGGAAIRARLDGDSIVLRVSDTGSGIESSSIKRLFEPFQQGDPAIRRKHGGTGLGLAISKRFVEMHGGRIWIESQVGRGTTVCFTLPIETQPADSKVKRLFSPYHDYVPRTQSPLTPAPSAKPHVLVYEQDSSLGALVEHYADDLAVESIGSPQALSRSVASDTIRALVINDMPAQARQLAAALPRTSFDIPILSCWVPGRNAPGSDMGVQGYLVKPIRRPELLAAIEGAAPETKHILLVDDDAEARQLFHRMLDDAPARYDVTETDNGESALEMMRDLRPDLVLLDLVMPGRDGVQVLATKAENDAIRDIPVIVVSARDPHREPVMSTALVVTRRSGLSARDLAHAIQAIAAALPPRFGAPAPHETLDPLPASG